MPLTSAQSSALLALSVASPRALPAYAYGTSGFRGLATTLDSIAVRMGAMAAVRSWSAGASAGAASCPAIGLVVTASHNEAPDNGVKLVDPSGEMMLQAWEATATRIANAPESDLPSVIDEIMRESSLIGSESSGAARVFVARDTRESSPRLRDLVVAGARALGAEVTDFGLATTPQLHWVVREANFGRTATIDAYYQTLARSFREAIACSARPVPTDGATLTPLVLDCANGVGALSVDALAPQLASLLPIERRNTGAGGLNDQCGAEHMQKCRALPLGFDLTADRGRKIASLDGDADRLVYGYVNDAGVFRLLDGDKIIALYTLFLRDLLASSGLAADLTIGIVQTAYANGASTLYMQRTLGVDVQFTNTGVKHLHHRAVEYDIGVYFESNGHGTVVFSQKAQERIREAANNTQQTQASRTAARCLSSLLSLINQCVGDAVSDLLLVELSLHHLGWGLVEWDAVYEDLPSAMLKVRVADRTVITTTNAERVCVTPAGLQAAIEALVATIPPGSLSTPGVRRSFVRPSGTEDIVRVYAEAATREECDELARQVCEVTAKMAGGV